MQYIGDLCVDYTHAKFQKDSFIFDISIGLYSEKNDVIFDSQFLGVLHALEEN